MKTAILATVLAAATALAQPTVDIPNVETERSPVPESLRREAEAAAQRATAWLLQNQQPEGHWSNPDFPALTALPVWAILRNGGDPSSDAIQRAAAYLAGTFNENGSFCREPREQRKGGGLCNYNTALVIVALHALGNPEHIPLIQKARSFIASGQHFGDDIYHGGMGYDADTGRPYADLSNSYLAYEAMRLTESVEDLRTNTGERADLDWEAARTFIERVQNRPESNDQDWASDDPENAGGFAYKPDSSMAGSTTNEAGEVRLRSYGSMTYAGLLSFIYAEVDKNDPRVQSAYDWSTKYWSLEENPGMDQQGLFYYYKTLAKALAALDTDLIQRTDGSVINWRTALVQKLISLQKTNPDGTGFWVNAEGRWWESDPVLVTAYSLLALNLALQ